MTQGRPTFRERLRALRTFPPGLPPFGVDLDDLSSAPAAPQDLFGAWLDDALAAGVGAPHAATLSTADTEGRVHARTLALKDVTDDGWWFAGHASSPKGRDLEANPHASLTFFWRDLGRQVRVTGRATSAGTEAGAADFRARPDGSRAAGLVGHQSEPLGSPQEYRDAFADRLEHARAHPDDAAPTWTAWVLTPVEVEFWQASDDKGQSRLRYRRTPAAGATRTTPTTPTTHDDTDITWTKELLWP
ncbi:pyridoxal 5'-phosphate synthase [Isoptericola sp. NEAU-Y5]|uniref:Pyridoxal 5'-phosphate synthase n=1 Tax=Isoptericola luteus TaxID=2879484 RepID=A0ABS7ZFC1_9MICO|nr:pyridoxal 5'-phosphate synthase [Isoptericola sp. NEAU-Y5]MCA5893725.1 pyridoxal 5'-phosphate synthase [Isoptericola sp. NEAU-Y5]